jgi:hypothetical protein
MNFVFASSHLPEDNRPQEEEEEDVQPMQRSGMVRAFSHLPQPVQGEPAAPRPFGPSSPAHLPFWVSEPPETEHKPEAETDADHHGDFEPPAPAGSDTHDTIGPSSSRGVTPPADRSLYLTPRPMPPEYARQQTTTYGAGPDNRGDASNSGNASPLGFGDPPAATGTSSAIDLMDIARRKYNPAPEEAKPKPATALPSSAIDLMDIARKKYNPDLYKANQEYDILMNNQRMITGEADKARKVHQDNQDNIKSLENLRTVLQGTKVAQDYSKKRLPKPMRVLLDKIMKESGLDPEAQMKNLETKINESKARTPENQKALEPLEEAERLAVIATQKAEQRKKELEERQKQPPLPPAAQPPVAPPVQPPAKQTWTSPRVLG